METFPASASIHSRKMHWVTVGFGMAILTTLGIFAVGCKKSQPTAVDSPPVLADTNQVPVAILPPAQPVASVPVVAAKPEGGADLKQLNHAYIGWVMQNRRRPKSYEEFVQLSGIQVPPPPAGKKYVIDGHGFINYANN